MVRAGHTASLRRCVGRAGGNRPPAGGGAVAAPGGPAVLGGAEGALGGPPVVLGPRRRPAGAGSSHGPGAVLIGRVLGALGREVFVQQVRRHVHGLGLPDHLARIELGGIDPHGDFGRRGERMPGRKQGHRRDGRLL